MYSPQKIMTGGWSTPADPVQKSVQPIYISSDKLVIYDDDGNKSLLRFQRIKSVTNTNWRLHLNLFWREIVFATSTCFNLPFARISLLWIEMSLAVLFVLPAFYFDSEFSKVDVVFFLIAYKIHLKYNIRTRNFKMKYRYRSPPKTFGYALLFNTDWLSKMECIYHIKETTFESSGDKYVYRGAFWGMGPNFEIYNIKSLARFWKMIVVIQEVYNLHLHLLLLE